VYLSIGPRADDRINTTISCPVAEATRDRLFLTWHTFDFNVLGNASQLRAKILEIRMWLAEGRTELDAARIPATQLGAIQSLKDTVLAAGLASAATRCIVSAATCKRALGASVALYQSDLASNVGDNAQASTQAQTEMNILDSRLQSIQDQITDNVAQQSKPRFGAVLNSMCATIRQQCSSHCAKSADQRPCGGPTAYLNFSDRRSQFSIQHTVARSEINSTIPGRRQSCLFAPRP
jgi:hypothetical protein